MIMGLKIIENAAKNENYADFIIGMGIFKDVMDMVYQKESNL